MCRRHRPHRGRDVRFRAASWRAYRSNPRSNDRQTIKGLIIFSNDQALTCGFASGWRDLNPRPLRPEHGSVASLTSAQAQSRWSQRRLRSQCVGLSCWEEQDHLPMLSQRLACCPAASISPNVQGSPQRPQVAAAAGHSVDAEGWLAEFDTGFGAIAGQFGSWRSEPGTARRMPCSGCWVRRCGRPTRCATTCAGMWTYVGM